MKLFENISSFYFLGIGGIGMSSLARYFNFLGYRVAGYDRTPSVLTGQLLEEGIPVHYEDLGDSVREITGSQDSTLVVYTPAIPPDHREWAWLRENGYRIMKRSQLLGMICNHAKCIAVAGTHGKTTISAMTATILSRSETGCGAFLGGISKNFRSNLVLPGADSQWIVTEADEFDHSFLQLTPDVAVITYMDADHLDIYGDREALKESFLQFDRQIRMGGYLVIRKELADEFASSPRRRVYTYSLQEGADFSVSELKANESTKCYGFLLNTPSGSVGPVSMRYPGLLNVENAVAAGAAAYLAGARTDEIIKGLEEYEGVERRFDIRYFSPKSVYIDDYGHHPAELAAFISSVKLIFPEREITGIFQPHLYTRTRDFAPQFAISLDLLDTALLLPVYPARERPIAGVTSELILRYMKIKDKRLAEKAEIEDFVRARKPDLLLTMGAGDIDLLAGDIIEALRDETGN